MQGIEPLHSKKPEIMDEQGMWGQVVHRGGTSLVMHSSNMHGDMGQRTGSEMDSHHHLERRCIPFGGIASCPDVRHGRRKGDDRTIFDRHAMESWHERNRHRVGLHDTMHCIVAWMTSCKNIAADGEHRCSKPDPVVRASPSARAETGFCNVFAMLGILVIGNLLLGFKKAFFHDTKNVFPFFLSLMRMG